MKKTLLFLIICAFNSSLLFSQNIDITIDAYQPTCPGQSATVYVIVNISTDYTLLWSNGSSLLYNYLTAGTYTVTATDVPTGDTAVAIVDIIDPPGLVLSAASSLSICPGASNGSIDLTVSGNSAPYTYNWSNGSINQDLYNVTSGFYDVTVSDVNYCYYYLYSIEVTEQPATILNISATDASCGGNNGSVNVSPGGAGGTFYYLWDDQNYSTNDTVYNLPTGIYHVTVTSEQGCLSFGSAIVNNIGAPTLIPYYTNILCNGNNTGSAFVNPQGGVSPYSYLWSNNETTYLVDSLFAGPIQVTVTDILGCQSIRLFDITQPPVFNVYLSKNNIPCSGSTGGGSMWITVDGGTPGYSYNWSNAEASNSIYNLTTGVYSVTVSDMNACTVILSDTIFDAVPISFNYNITEPSCTGSWTGSVDLTVSGGAPPYSYFWSSGQGYYFYDEDISGIPADNYSLNIYDNNSCSVFTTITLTDPPAMYADANITDVVCHGDSTGAIDITVNNGVAPFTFAWTYSNMQAKQNNISGNLMNASGFISDQEDITNVFAGVYNIDITDSLGCTLNQEFYIYENQAISFNLYPSLNPSCGLNDGLLNSQPIYNGLPPYTFLWSNGDTLDYSDSLSAGMYSLTVTDSAGCYVSNNVVLNNIAGPIIYLYPTDASCFGFADGSAFVSSSFSDSYLWSTGSTNDSITDLVSGTYYITVTDTAGCVAIGSVFVNQPEQLNITFNVTNPSCAGDANGYVYADVTGGSWEWSLLWSNDSTNAYFSNVSSGTYTLTVTDVMIGCQKIDSVIITEPPPIVINNISSTDITCYGAYDGTITIDASAGGQTLEYAINNDGFFPQNVFTGLSPSIYSVMVRFASGYTCIDTSSNDVVLNEPAQLSGSFEQTNITCYGANDGTITFTPFGGTPPYQFSIDGANTFGTGSSFSNLSVGTYILKIKDANNCMIYAGSATIVEPANINMNLYGSTLNCNGDADGTAGMTVFGGFPPYSFNWSNGATTQNIVNLGAGDYYVTVTDNHNCNYTDSTFVSEPTAIQINYNITNTLCFGSGDGIIDLTISGGTPSYAFLWDDNSINEDRSGLGAGTYSVTVTDFNGCLSNAAIVVTEPIAPVLPIINVVNVSCNGYQNGSASGNASGGTSPYSFYWSTDATTNNITDLTPATYMVTITDVNGCMVADTFNITEPNLLLIDSSVVINPTCFGFTDGSIIVYASGGTGTYQFTSDSINFQSTGVFNSLSAGTYTIEVIDANNCYYTMPVQTLIEPPQLSFNIIATNVACFGINNGSATVIVTGGTAPFNYLWTGGQITNTATNLTAGISYFVTVTDYNNCSLNDSVVISQPNMLVTSVSSTNASCNGVCDGTATVIVSGGTFPYTYVWNLNPSITASVINICAGLYIVTVTDLNGCIIIDTADITEPEALSLVTSSTVSACNICNGTATVIPTGGTFPYTYLWSNNDIFSVADSLCAGTFIVTVTDMNGCNATTNVSVTSQALSVISGEAHWSGGNLPDNTADVELYRILNITQAELSYSLPLTGSQFTFSNVGYGKYFIKVKVNDGTLFPNVLSTYLDSTFLWELADTVNVTCANNYNLHIPMYEMTQPVGSPIGTISGYITYSDFPGGGKGITAMEGVKLAGEPVPGAEIYVELEPDDEPIFNTTTNDTGYYEVSGLEGGNTYSMSVDIPGLPMITTYTNISINSDSAVYTQMNFYVDTSETSGGIFTGTSTPVIRHENATFNLEMYPNPFSDYMNINYNLSKPGNVNLEIYNIQGKVVATLVKEKQYEGAYKYVFNASGANLAEGTYIVKLQVDNTVYIKKILQIK